MQNVSSAIEIPDTFCSTPLNKNVRQTPFLFSWTKCITAYYIKVLRCHTHSPATPPCKYVTRNFFNMVLLTSREVANTQYNVIESEHHVDFVAPLSCSGLCFCFCCFICLYSCTTLSRSSSIILFLAMDGLFTDTELWPRREFSRRPLDAP